MEIPSFPKIFQIGSEHIPDIFKGGVEITEKIDGSMFAWGCTEDGHVVMRSKGKELFYEAHEKMFDLAVDFVADHEQWLLSHPKMFFYGEFLNKPKHNVLCYNQCPKNNIMLFGVYEQGVGFYTSYKELKEWAHAIGIEPVPLLSSGIINNKEELDTFLEVESCLGGQKVEGVVVKNYAQTIMIGSKIYPSFGKLVRQEFRETLNKTWTSGKDKVQIFIDSFRTEARWQKAIQHLKEQGLIDNEAKDIGKLVAEVKRDILEEEELNIKAGLYQLFKDTILRKATAGLPEWYKEQLLNKAFGDSNDK
jgi:hypothetical protein